MSQPWWGVETDAASVESKSKKLVDGEFGKRPQLCSKSPGAITAELRRRQPNYTPEWIDSPDRDAGAALVELFAIQFATIARRLNRLPDKTLVEFLDVAGVQISPARSSSALIQFTLSGGAINSVPVPKGFQVGARPAVGGGDLVVFETQTSQLVAPTDIAKLFTVQRATQRDITAANKDAKASFAPFGEKPEVGDAVLIGLAALPNVELNDTLSFGIRIFAAPGSPPPVSSGGVAPVPLPGAPVLRWEALVESQFQPVEVILDETSSLWRSGIVTLRVPPAFVASKHIGESPLFWLRLRLILGSFDKPPRLSFIRINMARVDAVRTIRDEVLEPIDNPASNRMRLKNTPVVPNQLVIEIEESVLSDDDGNEQPSVRQWQEVDELFSRGPTDKVFTLDSLTGIVTFGDGRHGAKVPPGFRNVRAASYKVGSGAESAVGRDEIKTLLNSAPFLTGVTNPLPASGGVANESQINAIRRGPETIRSLNRSVTVADYAVMASFAPGADIRRAHAISGYHPQFPGQHIPGVVGLLVVPQVNEEGPPIPDEQALRAAGTYLTSNVAPVGVEIVAAAPTYRFIRAEVGFTADRGGNPAEIIRTISDELDRYLHPLLGGDDGEGWPFGGTLFFAELLQRLLTKVDRILAIPRLRLIVDGVPQIRCGDIALKQTQLFWPLDHQVIPVETEDIQ
jgi:predicted phage baseplate assembly protein